MWSVPNIWDGGEVWIIGGGPSMTAQFGIPDEVVKRVLSKHSQPNVYSPYMEAIHKKHVIGINVAYMIGGWMDMIFFGDVSFFLGHANGIAKHPGIKVCSHHCAIPHSWIKYVPSNKRTWGISTDPKTVCWNGNSGAAAISIAANTGAKRIILVGFDMYVKDNTQQHWHDIYEKLTPMRKQPVIIPFETHLRGFPEIAKDAKSRGIEIINASPDSKITQFPKCNVKDLL